MLLPYTRAGFGYATPIGRVVTAVPMQLVGRASSLLHQPGITETRAASGLPAAGEDGATLAAAGPAGVEVASGEGGAPAAAPAVDGSAAAEGALRGGYARAATASAAVAAVPPIAATAATAAEAVAAMGGTGCDCLLVNCDPYSPSEVLRGLLPLLKPARPFAVFCTTLQVR